MDDPLRVGERRGVHRREHVGDQREPVAQRRARLDLVGERLAVDLPHHVVRVAVVVAAAVVDRDDRRVTQARRDPRLAREPGEELGGVRQRLLDRDGALERGVGGREHAAHAAATELLAERVAVAEAIERAGSRWRRARDRGLAVGRVAGAAVPARAVRLRPRLRRVIVRGHPPILSERRARLARRGRPFHLSPPARHRRLA